MPGSDLDVHRQLLASSEPSAQGTPSKCNADKPSSLEDCGSQSRRSLLNAALFIPTASLLGCIGPQTSSRFEAQESRPSFEFLNVEERAFVETATERLIPDEEDGLGARGAAIAVFIDRQLAGPYGRAERWYMQGPWATGIPEQGYQLKLTPGELYQEAVREVNAWCQKNHGNAFAGLAGAEQDEVLHGLESGEIELANVPAKVFFTMLWNNTVEGFLADPMYGGNRNFAGWNLIGFPGPRYNYSTEIEQYGKPYTLPTVGILGRNGTLLRKG